MESENWLCKFVLWYQYALHGSHVYIHIYTVTHKCATFHVLTKLNLKTNSYLMHGGTHLYFSTQKTEAERLPQISRKPGLYSKFQSARPELHSQDSAPQ